MLRLVRDNAKIITTYSMVIFLLASSPGHQLFDVARENRRAREITLHAEYHERIINNERGRWNVVHNDCKAN